MLTSPLHRPVSKSQRWVRLGILTIGAVIFLSYLGLDPLLRGMTKRDRLNGTPYEATALVVDRRLPKYDDYERPIPAAVTVRFQGKLYPTEAVFGFAELKVDSPAHIRYRIGASGRIYIDRVEPITDPTKPQ